MTISGFKVRSLADLLTATRYFWCNRRSALATIRALTVRGILPRSLVDFGAHNSEWSKYLKRKWPFLVVHSFEPNPETNPIGQIHRVALSTRTGNVTLGGKQSIQFFASNNGTLRVDCVRFDEYRKNLPLPAPAILKVDCENMTLEALQGCGESLSLFSAVHVELMNDDNAQCRNEQSRIHYLLWQAGFNYCMLTDCTVWPRTISSADGLYFRGTEPGITGMYD